MKKKSCNTLIVLLFLGYIATFLLLSLILPDKSFSQRENRYLQTLPKFSFARLFAGDFTADFEDYCADQFPLRDRWITLNARYEQLSGKKQTNGVYLCGDMLITPFTAPTDKELAQHLDAVKCLRDATDIPVQLALIPSASELYAALLPEGAPNDSQEAVICKANQNGLCPAPLLPALEQHKDETIFYRTDHHWTTLGAYYAYEALCESLGLEPVSRDSFSPETVSDDFYGTAYSTSGYTWVKPDSIVRFVDADAALSVMSYRNGQAAEGGLYHEESLGKMDQYTFFLGGNSPENVLIGRDSTLPKLLMIRDSYSDCLAPFLLSHYSEIRMLDLRYYLGSVKEYAESNDMDQILVIYSVENFCRERSVAALAE